MANNLYLDVLKMRRPPLRYESPAICDVIFSSTGFPSLSLDPIPVLTSVSGSVITWFGSEGQYEITWDTYPGAICYTIYKLNDANDPFGAYTIVAECITDPKFNPVLQDPGFDPEDPTCYLIQVITAQGPTLLSSPICSDCTDCEKQQCCDGVPDGFPGQPGNQPGGGTCPVILSQGFSPVVRQEGEPATVGPVGISVIGGVLKYEWFKDGVFYLDTTFTTGNRLEFGSMLPEYAGSYVLKISTTTSGCSPIFSDPIILAVATGFSWTNLIWGTPAIDSGNGAASGNWNENEWEVDVEIMAAPGPSPTTADNTATMNYTGLATINCNLKITVTTWDVPNAPATNCPITISQDADVILAINLSNEVSGVGEYNFPFQVQAGTGSVITISNAAAQVFNVGGTTHQRIAYSAELTPIV